MQKLIEYLKTTRKHVQKWCIYAWMQFSVHTITHVPNHKAVVWLGILCPVAGSILYKFALPGVGGLELTLST